MNDILYEDQRFKEGFRIGYKKGFYEGFQKGITEGEKEGIITGAEQGREQKSIKIAKTLIKEEKMNLYDISYVTDVGIETLSEIKESLKK
ncbi:hypothetical protein [uncultured Methanobrevibacter sp.]|uniref:hypothetical protein n=1 Tax=uncultured Methanobrevibacter sp. TaxID=253161 RepID=UPI00261A9AF1|nr:hypothetical protein [uncultured Methanobrevibacter sp.]